MDEDMDGWLEQEPSSARSTPRRDGFAELLAASGAAPLNEAQWGPLLRLLELLETRNYDAVAEVVRSLQSQAAGRPAGASGGEASRRATAPAGSKLAGSAWQTYWEQHRRRVLEAFRPAQRAVLEALELPGVLPLAEVADYLLGRVYPTLMSAELRQAIFDQVQETRVAQGLTPLADEERPAESDSAAGGETLSLQMPTVTTALGGQPVYSQAPLAFAADDAALVSLRDTAQAIVGYTGCPEVEAVAWLLADELPLWPLLSLRSQVCRWNGSPPHNHRYIIEVGSGLVSPEEVARFYRQQRDKDAWAGLPDCTWGRQPRAFTAELLAFVADARPGVPAMLVRGWPGLHRRWRERYPQKAYRNWRAMRETYLRVTRRVQPEGDGGDVAGTPPAP